ncbi:hypothetical protein ERJ75_000300300 [Trypanosoma vivax]|nr:hypothetical protein ERJ75_000300300 [Trypanosoma vivax]
MWGRSGTDGGIRPGEAHAGVRPRDEPARAVPPGDKAQFMDIIGVKRCCRPEAESEQDARRELTQMIDKPSQRWRGGGGAAPLAAGCHAAAQVTTQTLKQIEDIMNVTQIQNALASTDDQIKTQLAQLEKTNEIQNVAMHDGEMQVAEEQCDEGAAAGAPD